MHVNEGAVILKIMYMKKFLSLLLSILIFSCNINDDDVLAYADYSDYISGNSIDTDISFMAEERYNTTNALQAPSLKLKLTTTEIFPCINYGLVISKFIRDNELIIRFDAIYKPGICFTAMGSAISYVDLSQNTNIITFINGKTIDKYSIEINQKKVSITPIARNFTSSTYANTFRYPLNSFAYVCGTNTNNTDIYYDFLTVLKQNPNFTEINFEGEGRIPYPESSDGHWVNHSSKYFIYTDDKEFENLESILRSYSIENIQKNSGASIAIYGWNNVQYYSWLND